MRADLEHVGLASADDFLVRRTGSKSLIESLLAHSPVPANSDYFPFLDLNAGKARFREQSAGLFRSWGIARLPILEMLGVSNVLFTNPV
jgi:hypothetical protein